MEGVGGQITQGLGCRGCASWAAGAAGKAGCTLTRASPPGALAGGIQPEGRAGGGGTAQGLCAGEWAVGTSEERIGLMEAMRRWRKSRAESPRGPPRQPSEPRAGGVWREHLARGRVAAAPHKAGGALSEPQHRRLSAGPADGTWHSASWRQSVREVCKEPGVGPGIEALWASGSPQTYSYLPGGATPRDAAWGGLGSWSAGGLVRGSRLLAPRPGLELPGRM